MEYFREKRIAGLIDTKTCDRMMEIVNHMEENGCRFIEVIGSGTFGSVLKVKNNTMSEEMAAKVVQKSYASEGEITLWKNLKHPNILKLKDLQFVYHADSYIFLTEVYPKNLEEAIFESSFAKNKNASTQVIEWLTQILEAVSYLHDSNLSHNDLKGNNILISSNNVAVLSDFGFLSSAEQPIRKYGAPFIYRCPEGRSTESGLTEIDGKSLDIWCIGTMAFELFTGMSLLKRFSTWDEGPLTCWYTQVYPIIQNSLEKNNFVKLMEGAFPACKHIPRVADDALDFLISCLNIVPKKRSSVQQLKDHRIFGGKWQYTDDQVNIWNRKVKIQEFKVILQQYQLEVGPLTEIVDSENSGCGDYKDLKAHEETNNGDIDPAAIPQVDISHEEKENNQSKIRSLQSNFDVALIPVKSKEYVASHHHSSINISEQDLAPIFRLMFGSPVSSPVSVTPPPNNASELDDVPAITQCLPISRREKLRKWWNEKKASFIGFVTACCSCARKDSCTNDLTDCKS